jgi:hypothetical protein
VLLLLLLLRGVRAVHHHRKQRHRMAASLLLLYRAIIIKVLSVAPSAASSLAAPLPGLLGLPCSIITFRRRSSCAAAALSPHSNAAVLLSDNLQDHQQQHAPNQMTTAT